MSHTNLCFRASLETHSYLWNFCIFSPSSNHHPTFSASLALKLAKEAVNAAQDAQGRTSAMQTAFALHQLAHSHNMQVHGMMIDPSGLSPAVKR